jgi:hypothetical protein
MLSFNNDPKIKAKWVAKGHAHAAADMVMAGTYGREVDGKFKGCTMGCYAEREAENKHQNVADKVDGSERLNLCRDAIFEGLSQIDPKLGIEFHTQWIEAVPVGVESAEFDRVADKLILKATKWKAEKYGAPDNKHLLAAAALYERRIAGDEPLKVEWKEAARATHAAWGARGAPLYALDALYALIALDALDARAAVAVRPPLIERAALDGYYVSMRDEYLALMAGLEKTATLNRGEK